MNDEDFEYDSDHIDEETEARLYELAYYGEDSLRNSTLKRDEITDGSHSSTSHSPLIRFSQQELKANEILCNFKNYDSNDSSSNDDAADHKSNEHSSIENIFNDKERLKSTMEALFSMLTGRCPYSVEKKAEERMKRLGQKQASFRHDDLYFYATCSSNSSDEGPSSGKSEINFILGISNSSCQRLGGVGSIPKWFKDLPSDPKYWTLDIEDLRPGKRKQAFHDDGGICERCYGRGHSKWDCTRNGLFCILCAKEGHLQSSCPLRICPLCLLRGHDLPCPQKHQIYNTICFRCKQKGHVSNRCPDIWRQYRFSTKPGPPVKYEKYQNQTKTCFNCGRRGHLGHECRRSSVYGQPLLSQIVAEFDKHDVFGKATTNSAPHDVGKQPNESLLKDREFDEPLYCSFSEGPSNSLPETGTLDGDAQKTKRSRKCGDKRFGAGKRWLGNHQESKLTPRRFASRKNRRQAFGCSQAPFSPEQTTKLSALNGMLSKNNESHSFGRKRTNEPEYRDDRPSLFISNGFSPKKQSRSQFDGLPGDKNYRQGEKSFGDSFESRVSSSLRTQASPLRRILKHRKQIIKQRAKKGRNLKDNNLPNIFNSPFLQFVQKCSWNGGSSNVSPRSRRRKGEWKRNRLSL